MNSKIKSMGGRLYGALFLAAVACLVVPGAAAAKAGGATATSNDLTKIGDNAVDAAASLGDIVGLMVTMVGALVAFWKRDVRWFAAIFFAAIIARWSLDGGLWNAAGNTKDVLSPK